MKTPSLKFQQKLAVAIYKQACALPSEKVRTKDRLTKVAKALYRGKHAGQTIRNVFPENQRKIATNLVLRHVANIKVAEYLG